jgi:hypothetical protein
MLLRTIKLFHLEAMFINDRGGSIARKMNIADIISERWKQLSVSFKHSTIAANFDKKTDPQIARISRFIRDMPHSGPAAQRKGSARRQPNSSMQDRDVEIGKSQRAP